MHIDLNHHRRSIELWVAVVLFAGVRLADCGVRVGSLWVNAEPFTLLPL